MVPRLARRWKWKLLGTITTSTVLYYALHNEQNKKPTKTITGRRQHRTQEEVIDGRQVLWNLADFQWRDIPTHITERYTAPYKLHDSLLWRIGRVMVIGGVGALSKGVLSCLETTKVYHMDRFLSILQDHQRDRGIITVSNHLSVWDDPVLWGVLPMSTLLNIDKMRWVLGAADICYTTLFKANFFSLGQAIPTIRGGGIHQPAMDFALHKLNHGGWVHVFPEGKVNQTPIMFRFKWGIGRLIMEADTCPIIIPMWHQGMENVRPLRGPFAKFFQPVVVAFGEPVDCDAILDAWRKGDLTEVEARIQLTNKMVEALEDLKKLTLEEMKNEGL